MEHHGTLLETATPHGWAPRPLCDAEGDRTPQSTGFFTGGGRGVFVGSLGHREKGTMVLMPVKSRRWRRQAFSPARQKVACVFIAAFRGRLTHALSHSGGDSGQSKHRCAGVGLHKQALLVHGNLPGRICHDRLPAEVLSSWAKNP